MVKKLYYSVNEGYDGHAGISSLLGETKAKEREYARTMYRKCHGVYTSFEEAQRKLTDVRKAISARTSRQ
jgi:hypothetical protein